LREYFEINFLIIILSNYDSIGMRPWGFIIVA